MISELLLYFTLVVLE